MSLISIKKQIRQNTIDVISVLPELVDYTIFNAPLSSIELSKAPFISLFLASESANSSYHRDPAMVTTFELVIQIVYKQGARDGFQGSWADALEEVECAIQEGLFENATWLEQFTDVPSYAISRDLEADGQSLFAVSTITLILEKFVAYEANR